jgi:hypothetical protein
VERSGVGFEQLYSLSSAPLFEEEVIES